MQTDILRICVFFSEKAGNDVNRFVALGSDVIKRLKQSLIYC